MPLLIQKALLKDLLPKPLHFLFCELSGQIGWIKCVNTKLLHEVLTWIPSAQNLSLSLEIRPCFKPQDGSQWEEQITTMYYYKFSNITFCAIIKQAILVFV